MKDNIRSHVCFWIFVWASLHLEDRTTENMCLQLQHAVDNEGTHVKHLL